LFFFCLLILAFSLSRLWRRTYFNPEGRAQCSTLASHTLRLGNQEQNKESKTTHTKRTPLYHPTAAPASACHVFHVVPDASSRTGHRVWTRRWWPPFRPRSLPFSPAWLCLRVAYAPRWSSPFPYLSSFFGFSIFAGRDPLVFMLEPSLRSGDPVAYLECINVGGGDSILTAFGVLEVAGGEAGPPLTWPLPRLGPCLGAGGPTVWCVAWLAYGIFYCC